MTRRRGFSVKFHNWKIQHKIPLSQYWSTRGSCTHSVIPFEGFRKQATFCFCKENKQQFQTQKGAPFFFLSLIDIRYQNKQKAKKTKGFKQNLYFFWILVRAFTFFRDVLKLYFIFFWILFREWLSISGDNICPPPPAQCITSLSSRISSLWPLQHFSP